METSPAAPPASGASALTTGFVHGLFGFLVALVGFGYVGLFAGGADPADQLAAGLGVAYSAALVALVVAVTVGIRARRHRPGHAAGLLAGVTVGLVLLILLSVRVVGLMGDAPSHCPCEPIVDQVHVGHD